ncbi:MAG: hypothetical protein N2255_00675, partial [Kiritimatiellae bacterium]|nr:hypothetical protein [Kiritimatiellia bacterium]
HPDHFLVPEALLVRARCLELLGRLDEAKSLYERIVAEREGSGWARRAGEMLRTMDERVRWRARRVTRQPPETLQPLGLLSLTNAFSLAVPVPGSTGSMARGNVPSE